MGSDSALVSGIVAALPAVETEGWACLDEVVSAARCADLLEEVSADKFETMAEVVGQVRQGGTQFQGAANDSHRPVASGVAAALQHAGVADGTDRFRPFAPNEVCYQHYPVGSVGVTAHRDSMRYRSLVAIFTLRGSARFEVVADRSARKVLGSFEAQPGTVILLRAPMPSGLSVTDDRLFHLVGGPVVGPRTSLTFRMEE